MANAAQCAVGIERLILGQELTKEDVAGIRDYIISGGLRFCSVSETLKSIDDTDPNSARQVFAQVFKKAVKDYFNVVGG